MLIQGVCAGGDSKGSECDDVRDSRRDSYNCKCTESEAVLSALGQSSGKGQPKSDVVKDEYQRSGGKERDEVESGLVRYLGKIGVLAERIRLDEREKEERGESACECARAMDLAASVMTLFIACGRWGRYASQVNAA